MLPMLPGILLNIVMYVCLWNTLLSKEKAPKQYLLRRNASNTPPPWPPCLCHPCVHSSRWPLLSPPGLVTLEQKTWPFTPETHAPSAVAAGLVFGE